MTASAERAERAKVCIDRVPQRELMRFQPTTTRRDGRRVRAIAPIGKTWPNGSTRGATDVVMKLFGPNSPTRLIAEDDDSGLDLNGRITASLVAGEYVVQVRHYNRASGMGNYTVKVAKA